MNPGCMAQSGDGHGRAWQRGACRRPGADRGAAGRFQCRYQRKLDIRHFVRRVHGGPVRHRLVFGDQGRRRGRRRALLVRESGRRRRHQWLYAPDHDRDRPMHVRAAAGAEQLFRQGRRQIGVRRNRSAAILAAAEESMSSTATTTLSWRSRSPMRPRILSPLSWRTQPRQFVLPDHDRGGPFACHRAGAAQGWPQRVQGQRRALYRPVRL